MQEAGFRAAGIAATYERVETPPEQLGQTVRRLRDAGFAGWNVTVPHKERIGAFLDATDPAAAPLGSLNTVRNDGGRLTGYSTDGYGLATAIREAFAIEVPGRAFAFLGCGGAARATALHFALGGARELLLINRTRDKAEALTRQIAESAKGCRTHVLSPGDLPAIRAALAGCDVLVQATSLGLRAGDPLPLPAGGLPAGLRVMDMICRHTPFLEAAGAAGCVTADGRAMLLHQGARSFSIWTGREAPLAAMRAALDAALAASSGGTPHAPAVRPERPSANAD